MHLIFDTETTDLVTNSLLPLMQQPRIIEFYGVLIDDNGRDIEELEFVCNPGISISPEVTKITGFTDMDVADKPQFSQYLWQVEDIIGKATNVVAHNLSYDKFVVDCEFARSGKEVKWPASQICTVEATEWIKGYRLNLSALHEHLFGEPFSGAHRARQDVQALKSCFLALRDGGEV